MSVEVRNLQTGETFAVGNDGAIFGREGGGAAIQVQDRSVSKKHARVFTDGVEWFLEDMGSVNGTVVDGNKIGGAVALRVGLVFSLSKFRFEIVRLPQAYRAPPDVETRTSMRKSGNNGNAQDLPSELRKDPIPKKRAPAREVQAHRGDIDDDLAPPPARHNERDYNSMSGQDYPPQPYEQQQRSYQQQQQQQQDYGQQAQYTDEPRAAGSDEYEDMAPPAALAAGIAYALKTVPLLALNPLGTVRNQIAEQPVPTMEKIPLAAFLFPALAFAAAVNGVAGAIAATIGGAFTIGAFIQAPIVGVVAGVLGGLVSGFAGHPVLTWLLNKLEGQADARARTSFIAMSAASGVVVAVPSALSVVLAAVIAKLATVSSVFLLLKIVPALMTLVALPLLLYVQWQWWKSFGVVKWVQTVFMVLLALAALVGAYSCVTTVWDAVKGMSAAVSSSTDTSDSKPDSDKPDSDSKPDSDKPDTKPADTKPTDTKPTDTKPTDTKPADKPATTTTTQPTTPTTTTTATPTTATTAVNVDDGYATFAKKRANIEALLERDPTLVVRNETVAALYENLLTRTAEAEALVYDRYSGKKRTEALNPLYEKAKKAEVYDKTRVDVTKLHRVLFGD
jgi:hypothetical protein